MIEEIRGDDDVIEFMDSIGLDRSTYYKWRDEGAEPSEKSLRKIEKARGVKFIFEEGEIRGWKRAIVGDTLSVRQLSNTLTPQGQRDWITFMSQDPGEDLVVAMYREDAVQEGLPEWESLSTRDRDIVMSSYLAFVYEIRKEFHIRHKLLVQSVKSNLSTSVGSEDSIELSPES